MSGKRLGLLAVIAALALASPGKALAARVVLPQPGDIGFVGVAQYGTLLNSGEIGKEFSNGPGFGLRLRYRMRYERGLGLSFERHGFDPRHKVPPPPSPLADTTASNSTVLLTGFDLYQMFGTRTRTTKMLSAGIGLAQVSQKLNDGETQSAGAGVGDGFYAGVGGEIEYFFWQSWAVDMSLRYNAVILHDTTNHDFQFGVGLVFYASD